MQSFRTELEQAVSLKDLSAGKAVAQVEKDIVELGTKIAQFKNGSLNEDKFRALRLARGVYGQRQQGVQMIRIKLPFGKVTTAQLRRIAGVSDEYSTGKLHITTRQDIQIHYVSLDRTPQLWADLEKDDVTLREACGNTVRNVTASAIAGIDPKEPFDVSPYADLVYRYFLRKPFGQELGRKIKIAFSSNETDDVYTFIHDFGFIPKVKLDNGTPVRGFKVLVGGGLGAQPFLAQPAFEFLRAEEIVPFIEAAIRVFDRHGERNSRHKARMKYLIAKLGLETFLELVRDERLAVQYQSTDFQLAEFLTPEIKNGTLFSPFGELVPALCREGQRGGRKDLETGESAVVSEDAAVNVKAARTEGEEVLETESEFLQWKQTNVFHQKQTGYLGVFLKIQLGNLTTAQARRLAAIADTYAAGDLRFTIDQSVLLKFVLPETLYGLYTELKAAGLADAGYDSLADVTACPGTDTCNLGISNSTEVARVIEGLVRKEYHELIGASEIRIKISGCMNSCGQHGLAHIGFHGSSMKVGQATVPALQVLLGGGKTGNGTGRVAEKVIKLPSRRVEACIRILLNDYGSSKTNTEPFNAYYDRRGNRYFYDLLKPLADTASLEPTDFIDWGQDEQFKTAIGIGECAGVMIDLVATLVFDAEEKLDSAQEAMREKRYADAVYFAYAAGIHVAKALLLEQKVHCNTHQGIIADFDTHLGERFGFPNGDRFPEFLLELRKTAATPEFAKKYVNGIGVFIEQAKESRIV